MNKRQRLQKMAHEYQTLLKCPELRVFYGHVFERPERGWYMERFGELGHIYLGINFAYAATYLFDLIEALNIAKDKQEIEKS